ncbi:MAG: GntR family transcriptional regulator, partial [Shinella sp.]
ALISAARSNWLLRFQATISDQLRRHHRFLSLAPAMRAAEGRSEGYEEAVAALRDAMAIEHHTELMEAALDRNINHARALMADHIGFTVNVYAQSEDGSGSLPALQAQPSK